MEIHQENKLKILKSNGEQFLHHGHHLVILQQQEKRLKLLRCHSRLLYSWQKLRSQAIAETLVKLDTELITNIMLGEKAEWQKPENKIPLYNEMIH